MCEPRRVVVEIAVERGHRAIGNQQEAVTGAAQEGAVVRHDDHRPGELLQRDQQGVAHLQVEVVGGLVEQQQVGSAGDQDRERQPGALAAGKASGRLEHTLATKAEATQMVAPLLLEPRATPGRRV